MAAGVLLAGSSTGFASPPLAAAIDQAVVANVRDSAQTLVNAGTGLGVLVSRPVALVLAEHWRWAWGAFAVVARLVTVAVARALPASGTVVTAPAVEGPWVRGSAALLAAASVLGLSSIAVWTFGQQAVREDGRVDWLAPVVWTVIGAVGIAGALSARLVGRLGVQASWRVLMVLLALGTAGLGLGAGVVPVALVAGAVFGAAYIALTGALLVWAVRCYGSRPALGVDLAFLTIAVGQAVGAVAVGSGAVRSNGVRGLRGPGAAWNPGPRPRTGTRTVAVERGRLSDAR